VLGWQQVIYAENQLPGWLQDSLINILAIISQQSFWAKSADPNHWWGEEGIFSVNESLISCPQQSCIACDWIGQWPIDIFFPDLARSNLRVFKHHQKNYGQTPSTLGPGAEPDRLWYDQQISIDCQVYAYLIDRHWQRTGDDEMLEEIYPSVKAAIVFLQSADQERDGLVDVFGVSHYYDAWGMSGAAIHVSGYWLATLKMVERMAEKMGDTAFADECRNWYDRGRKSLEEKLWNEEVGSYLLYNNTKTGEKSDTVLSDQLTGEFFARIHGLESIFPKDRVLKVLATLERLNVAATPYGIRTSLRPDGSDDKTGFYAPLITPSYSTIVPTSVMMYSGDGHFSELGMEIVRRTWYNMVFNQQMTWDMPCMLNADGTLAWGLEYWHNPMLWAFPIAVLEKNLSSFSAPGGLVDRITSASRRKFTNN